MHLEDTLVMHGVFSTETLEKLKMHGDCGIQHYAINSMLYLSY